MTFLLPLTIPMVEPPSCPWGRLTWLRAVLLGWLKGLFYTRVSVLFKLETRVSRDGNRRYAFGHLFIWRVSRQNALRINRTIPRLDPEPRAGGGVCGGRGVLISDGVGFALTGLGALFLEINHMHSQSLLLDFALI